MTRLLSINRTAPSFMQRQRAAHEAAADREARLGDPLYQARVRASQAASAAARVLADAGAEWRNLNDPVPSGLPAEVHPQVRDLILRVLAEHGVTDPKAPIVPTATAQEIAGSLLAEARRAEKEADAEVARIEAERATEVEPVTVAKAKPPK